MEKISLDTQSMSNLSFQLFPSKAELILGLVQISHGMAEHKARYLEFIDFLNVSGFHVVIRSSMSWGQCIG